MGRKCTHTLQLGENIFRDAILVELGFYIRYHVVNDGTIDCRLMTRDTPGDHMYERTWETNNTNAQRYDGLLREIKYSQQLTTILFDMLYNMLHNLNDATVATWTGTCRRRPWRGWWEGGGKGYKYKVAIASQARRIQTPIPSPTDLMTLLVPTHRPRVRKKEIAIMTN